jgi:prephenate dehydrogenase
MNDKNKFPIGIIGGTGGIGRWFASFFEKDGFPVHVSGRKSGLQFPEMAEICPVVIVAVPISDTVSVIEKVGPFIKEGNLLMDMTSLKAEPVNAMLGSSISEVIGVHPLFGPDVASLGGQNVILCPGRGEKWISWLTGILQRHGACITMSSAEKHDHMMSLVQALNHLNTIAFGLALQESGVDSEELDRFSTPIFRMKKGIIDKLFSNNPKLYAEIISFNPEKKQILDLYMKILSELKRLIEQNDSEGITKLIKK